MIAYEREKMLNKYSKKQTLCGYQAKNFYFKKSPFIWQILLYFFVVSNKSNIRFVQKSHHPFSKFKKKT